MMNCSKNLSAVDRQCVRSGGEPWSLDRASFVCPCIRLSQGLSQVSCNRYYLLSQSIIWPEYAPPTIRFGWNMENLATFGQRGDSMPSAGTWQSQEGTHWWRHTLVSLACTSSSRQDTHPELNGRLTLTVFPYMHLLSEVCFSIFTSASFVVVSLLL